MQKLERERCTRLKALVLTCDRYSVFAKHMIEQYAHLWPDHPFRFVLPCQDSKIYADLIKRQPIHLIHCDPSIAQSFRALAQYCDPEEIVYWCIDDHYPVTINVPVMTSLASKVSIWQSDFDGVLPIRHMLHNSYLFKKSKMIYLFSGGPGVYYRRDLSHFWLHQFFRADILQQFAAQLPRNLARAKDMDYILEKFSHSARYRLGVLNDTAISFGESTVRGRVTENCYQSIVRRTDFLSENWPRSGVMVMRPSPLHQTARGRLLEQALSLKHYVARFFRVHFR
jgi:hypothetical protein